MAGTDAWEIGESREAARRRGECTCDVLNKDPRCPKHEPTGPKEVAAVVRGLLKIAEIAMPDTYFATDRRVKRAKKLLKRLRR